MAKNKTEANCNGSSSNIDINAPQEGENEIELQDLTPGAVEEPEPEPEKSRSKWRLIAVLAGLSLAMFTSALDQTVVATAVPTIVSELHAAGGYVWIGSAYLLANAAAGPIWAKISDIWGRKVVILTAIALFMSSSVLCAEARSMKMLIVARSLQGCAGGGMIQLVMITISDLFSIRHRSLYYGLLEVVWAVGGLGPLAGGYLTDRLSWRFAFWITFPISGLTFLLLLVFLDVHNPRTSMVDGFKAVDWAGSLSILAMTLMLLLGLEFGGATFPWKSPQVLCLIIVGSLLSLLFIFSEKKLARYPIMPMELFKSASNTATLLLCFGHGMVYIAAEYYLPLYFQSVLSASPSRSGALILPIVLTEALTGIGAGIFIHRTGNYLIPIYFGVVLMIIGNALYTLLSSVSSVPQIIGLQIVAGLGQGLLFQAPLIAIQASVSQADTATATSTFGFIRNLSNSLSIVICGVIFQNGMDKRVHALAGPPSNLPADVVAALVGGHAAANVMIVGKLDNESQKAAVREAFVWSLRNMWVFSTCVAGLAGIASFFVRKAVLSEEHTETKTGLREMEKIAVLAGHDGAVYPVPERCLIQAR